MTALVVLAKAPVPGRVKTRLCPPCSPAEAARLASAALADTLATVAGAAAERHVLAIDGRLEQPVPDCFEVVGQRGGGLDERLAAAFEDVGGPAFLVGMDTPQVAPGLLATALGALDAADAVVGDALDGGYWGIGLRRPDRRAFVGVPMSRADTGAAQRARLAALGLRIASLPPLQDVDDIASARAVARAAPGTRFAAELERVLAGCRA